MGACVNTNTRSESIILVSFKSNQSVYITVLRMGDVRSDADNLVATDDISPMLTLPLIEAFETAEEVSPIMSPSGRIIGAPEL
jgi:hypothetical protein